MSRRRREFAIQLKFSTRRCRCGDQRLLGRSCVVCGARPRSGEVDTEVQRRKRILARVKDADFALSADEDVSFTDLVGRLCEIVDTFLRPLAGVSRPDSPGAAVDQLIEAAQQVEQLVNDADVPLPRPFREVGKVVARIASLVRESLFGFLEVLGADDPLEVEARQQTAQAHLDSATAQIPELKQAQQDLLLAISLDNHGGLIELVTRRLMEAPQAGILGADLFGQATVRRIIGPGEEPADGAGIGVLWGSAFAQVIFDYDRFCMLASTLYRLISGPGAFATLAGDPAWRQRHERALVALLDSSDTLEQMLSIAPHDRAVLRSSLLFVQDVFEGACKHFAATILAQTGSQPYAQLMEDGRSAQLVRQVNDKASTRVLAEGRLGRLRTASGHYDFEVRGELVVIDPGPREIVRTAGEFSDDLLYFVESAAALCLAFEVALLQRGTPTTLTGSGHSLLAPDYVISLLATAAGLQDVQVNMATEVVSVAGTGVLEAPMPTAGALLAVMPETAEHLSLSWDEGEQRRQLMVPIPLAHRYLKLDQTDAFEKELAFIELCCMTTLDGESFYTSAAFRHWVGLKAGEVVRASAADFGRRFRVLRELAVRVGDFHADEVLRLVTRVQRLMVQGELAEPAAREALDELSAWESTPISEVFVQS